MEVLKIIMLVSGWDGNQVFSIIFADDILPFTLSSFIAHKHLVRQRSNLMSWLSNYNSRTLILIERNIQVK